MKMISLIYDFAFINRGVVTKMPEEKKKNLFAFLDSLATILETP